MPSFIGWKITFSMEKQSFPRPLFWVDIFVGNNYCLLIIKCHTNFWPNWLKITLKWPPASIFERFIYAQNNRRVVQFLECNMIVFKVFFCKEYDFCSTYLKNWQSNFLQHCEKILNGFVENYFKKRLTYDKVI